MQFPTWTIMNHHEPSWTIMNHGRIIYTYIYNILYIITYQNIWLSPGSFHQSPQRFPKVFVHQFLLHSSCRTENPAEADFFFVPIYAACVMTKEKKLADDPRRLDLSDSRRPAGKISRSCDSFSKSFRELFGVFFKHRKVIYVLFFHQLCWCVPFLYRFDPQWLIRAPCFLTAQWWRHKTKHTIPCGRLYPTWIPVDVQWYIHIYI